MSTHPPLRARDAARAVAALDPELAREIERIVTRREEMIADAFARSRRGESLGTFRRTYDASTKELTALERRARALVAKRRVALEAQQQQAAWNKQENNHV